MTSRATIVCCSLQGRNWRWVEHLLGDVASFTFVTCPQALKFKRFNLSRLIGSFSAVLCARQTNAAVLLTHDPSLAFWCATFASLLGMKTVIFAHAFNFSVTPTGLKLAMFKRAFRRINHFAVFSESEQELYSRTFGIDRARFDFVHWGVNPPIVARPEVPMIAGEYVSAVGGNSRDYQTLIEAARLLPSIKFALVVRPENLLGLKLPTNVVVHTNIPFGDAMNILSHSSLTVIPLDRTDAPCGHVTIVAAMYLGAPVVATRSVGIDDYVVNGETGIVVEPKSPSSMADAISRLLNDNLLRERIARDAKAFAEQNCSEASVAAHFRKWLKGCVAA